MSASPIDRVLARVRLEDSTYRGEDIDAAEQRIAARVADRLLDGALSVDNAMLPVREQIALPRQMGPKVAGLCHGMGDLLADAADDLGMVSRTVVARPDALHEMSRFIGERLLDPDGALVMGCILYLAGRTDSAGFWWQFAAGAGDTMAACCLVLYHLSLGEIWEAHWWCRQADPAYTRCCEERVWISEIRRAALHRALETAEEATGVTDAAAAVVGYVPTAIEYVDDVDLPLPTAGFAERIEELTASI